MSHERLEIGQVVLYMIGEGNFAPAMIVGIANGYLDLAFATTDDPQEIGQQESDGWVKKLPYYLLGTAFVQTYRSHDAAYDAVDEGLFSTDDFVIYKAIDDAFVYTRSDRRKTQI